MTQRCAAVVSVVASILVQLVWCENSGHATNEQKKDGTSSHCAPSTLLSCLHICADLSVTAFLAVVAVGAVGAAGFYFASKQKIEKQKEEGTFSQCVLGEYDVPSF